MRARYRSTLRTLTTVKKKSGWDFTVKEGGIPLTTKNISPTTSPTTWQRQSLTMEEKTTSHSLVVLLLCQSLFNCTIFGFGFSSFLFLFLSGGEKEEVAGRFPIEWCVALCSTGIVSQAPRLLKLPQLPLPGFWTLTLGGIFLKVNGTTLLNSNPPPRFVVVAAETSVYSLQSAFVACQSPVAVV